jgi:UDP-2-acetamido-3-amino-2,3-dideoxy-glucuronate N-acetyltransferase
MAIRIHPTAEVSSNACIGEGTSIWHQCQILDGASIGQNCILGKGVFIDAGVSIGNNVKIQNYVSIYHGVQVEDGVFIGPQVCFTNDRLPRAIRPDGILKTEADWNCSKTIIQHGASLGANVTILCGVTIGEWAMVGAGSLVAEDVPAHGLVYGNPAHLHGFVCACGYRLSEVKVEGRFILAQCTVCSRQVKIKKQLWGSVH